jgi:hypothetical protein
MKRVERSMVLNVMFIGGCSYCGKSYSCQGLVPASVAKVWWLYVKSSESHRCPIHNLQSGDVVLQAAENSPRPRMMGTRLRVSANTYATVRKCFRVIACQRQCGWRKVTE